MDSIETGSRPRDRYIGRPMPRFEDQRLVRGAGRYTDDMSVPNQVYAIFVRAPHAHAQMEGDRAIRSN